MMIYYTGSHYSISFYCAVVIGLDCGVGCGGEMCNIPYGTIPSLFSSHFPSSSLFSLFSSFSLFLSALLLCLEPLCNPTYLDCECPSISI